MTTVLPNFHSTNFLFSERLRVTDMKTVGTNSEMEAEGCWKKGGGEVGIAPLRLQYELYSCFNELV